MRWKALTASLKMDGEAYLEKIVQAPFHLPAVDRQQLQQKLFNGLDSIIDAHPMPFAFDQGRWSEVYSDGLDRMISKPRDIVRILNAISVAYPPVAGEVNPIDFIALEFLRVFEPSVYGTIRDAKNYFCGIPSQLDNKKSEEKAYFEAWKASLPDGRRDRRGEEDRRQTWISEISFSEWASHLAAFRKRALARQTSSRGTTASDALHTTGVKHRAFPNS